MNNHIGLWIWGGAFVLSLVLLGIIPAIIVAILAIIPGKVFDI